MKTGNSIITLPIVLILSIIVICSVGVLLINILKPYIMYEKLLSTTLKYMFVLEEYGYLNKNDKESLINELEKQGFNKEYITIDATDTLQDYGDVVHLCIEYYYTIDFPLVKENTMYIENKPYTGIMRVNKYGVSKR